MNARGEVENGGRRGYLTITEPLFWVYPPSLIPLERCAPTGLLFGSIFQSARCVRGVQGSVPKPYAGQRRWGRREKDEGTAFDVPRCRCEGEGNLLARHCCGCISSGGRRQHHLQHGVRAVRYIAQASYGSRLRARPCSHATRGSATAASTSFGAERKSEQQQRRCGRCGRCCSGGSSIGRPGGRQRLLERHQERAEPDRAMPAEVHDPDGDNRGSSGGFGLEAYDAYNGGAAV